MAKRISRIVILLFVLLSFCSLDAFAQNGTISIEADRFILNGETRRVHATGNVIVLQKELKITGTVAEYLQQSKEVSIWENVRMTYKDAEMTCDRITVDGIREIVHAEGNVRYRYQDVYGQSHKATFYAGDERVVLSGDPEVRQGADYIIGEEIVVYLQNKRITTTGRTRIRLSPDKFQ